MRCFAYSGASDTYAIHQRGRRVKNIWYSESSIQLRACLLLSSTMIYLDQRLYALAALVKSLADVPEQIWHALENHRYLHAGRLYTLSKAVHDYLDTGFDDIYVRGERSLSVKGETENPHVCRSRFQLFRGNGMPSVFSSRRSSQGPWRTFDCLKRHRSKSRKSSSI